MAPPLPPPSPLRRAAWLAQRARDDLVRQVRGWRSRGYHSSRPHKVVMTLLARDEADIIAATIEHALNAGVDFIVATDNRSVDSTTDILKAYEAAGVLEYRLETAQTYQQSQWVTAMARHAVTGLNASWVLNSDADEFLWAKSGPQKDSLRRILPGIDPRYGLVGLPELQFEPDPKRRKGTWSETTTAMREGGRFRGGTYPFWKVMNRGDPDVSVLFGNHIAGGPRIGPVAPEQPFVVLHFPDRGYAQYERKVRIGARAVLASPIISKSHAILLREDYALLEAGKLEEVYGRRFADIAKRLADGRLVRDTRLREHLISLIPTAVRPDLLKAALGLS